MVLNLTSENLILDFNKVGTVWVILKRAELLADQRADMTGVSSTLFDNLNLIVSIGKSVWDFNFILNSTFAQLTEIGLINMHNLVFRSRLLISLLLLGLIDKSLNIWVSNHKVSVVVSWTLELDWTWVLIAI
jgi:hypothetical protein